MKSKIKKRLQEIAGIIPLYEQRDTNNSGWDGCEGEGDLEIPCPGFQPLCEKIMYHFPWDPNGNYFSNCCKKSNGKYTPGGVWDQDQNCNAFINYGQSQGLTPYGIVGGGSNNWAVPGATYNFDSGFGCCDLTTYSPVTTTGTGTTDKPIGTDDPADDGDDSDNIGESLKNIIRESIKQLMNEQISPDCMGANMIPACPNQGTQQYKGWYNAGQQVTTITLGGSGGTPACMTINGQDITSANIGDLIYANPPYPPGPTGAVHPSIFAGGSECDVYEIIAIIDPLVYYNSPPSVVIDAVPAVCGNPNTPCEIGGTNNPIFGGGCTDPTAINYNPNATVNDGSCIATVYGCMDSNAMNYYAGAQIDDGSCLYEGCADSTATNYEPENFGCNQDPNNTSCCIYPPDDGGIDPTIEPKPKDKEEPKPKSDKEPIKEICCEWCSTVMPDEPSTPPPGCEDWQCKDCEDIEGGVELPGGNPTWTMERFQKLANIKK